MQRGNEKKMEKQLHGSLTSWKFLKKMKKMQMAMILILMQVIFRILSNEMKPCRL